jgi:histidine triad (HIT) family protein
MNCLFCEIIHAKVPAFTVWENDSFLAFLDIHPINPGHTLLIPKEHVEDVFAMSDETIENLFVTAKKLAPSLKKATSAKRIGIIVEGFGVPHVHVHLVPVNNGNELNPERAKEAAQEELNEMWGLIQDQLTLNGVA